MNSVMDDKTFTIYKKNLESNSFHCCCRSIRGDIHGKYRSIEDVNKPPVTSSASSKHKLEKGSLIVEALCEMSNCCMQVELAKCRLQILQKQEARKEKDVEHKEKQENARQESTSLTSGKEFR